MKLISRNFLILQKLHFHEIFKCFFYARSERDANVRLRGEAGIVKKKLQSVTKDTEEYKTNITKMTTENQKLHIAIKNMEKDIVDLKNEIRNRDETISEKEKTITDLKRTGIELEKNRFVLEHKIGIIISKYYI